MEAEGTVINLWRGQATVDLGVDVSALVCLLEPQVRVGHGLSVWGVSVCEC